MAPDRVQLRAGERKAIDSNILVDAQCFSGGEQGGSRSKNVIDDNDALRSLDTMRVLALQLEGSDRVLQAPSGIEPALIFALRWRKGERERNAADLVQVLGDEIHVVEPAGTQGLFSGGNRNDQGIVSPGVGHAVEEILCEYWRKALLVAIFVAYDQAAGPGVKGRC